MSITISDVANAAGVSKSTVSKVLNNSSTISPATIERVQKVMKELHYTPNQRAVSFARQTTDNIVYLTNLGPHSAFLNPHMFDIMCGVHKELTSSGYTMTLVDTSSETYPENAPFRKSSAAPQMVWSFMVLPLPRNLQSAFWRPEFRILL